MIESLKYTWNELYHLLKSKDNSFFFILLLSVFGSWNGIQFILSSQHIFSLINARNFSISAFDLYNTYTSFIPVTAFIFLSMILGFWFLKILSDIFLLDKIKKRLNLKEKFTLFFNFSVPAFFLHFALIFLFVTILLFSVLLYLVLLAIGIKIPLNILLLLIASLKYFLLVLFAFSLLLNDLTLYFQYHNQSFKTSLRNTYYLIKQNKQNFLLYILSKLILILFSISLFLIVLRLLILPFMNIAFLNYFYTKFSYLINLGNWQDYLVNLLKLKISFIFSIGLFALISSLFMLYARILTWNLLAFNPFLQKNIEASEKINNLDPDITNLDQV